MFLRTASQSSSNLFSSRPRYLNKSTPLAISAPSSPVRIKVVSVHLLDISTSRLCHLICVFFLHIAVCRCLISRPAGIWIPKNSERGSGSASSWTISTHAWNFWYMKLSCICLYLTYIYLVLMVNFQKCLSLFLTTSFSSCKFQPINPYKTNIQATGWILQGPFYLSEYLLFKWITWFFTWSGIFPVYGSLPSSTVMPLCLKSAISPAVRFKFRPKSKIGKSEASTPPTLWLNTKYIW